MSLPFKGNRFRDRARPARWRIGVLMLAVCIGAGLVATAVWQDRRAEELRARVQAAGHARALAEHAASVMRAVEVTLDRVEHLIQGRSVPDLRADGELYKILSDLQIKFPQVDSVFVIDPEGRTLVSSRAFPMPPYDVRDREFFTAAKTGHEGLYVSAPFRGAMSRSVGFVLSRPMIQNGRFAGVVAASMSPSAFDGFYNSVLGGSGAAVALVRSDGAVLVRSDGAQKWPDRLPERSDLMAAAGAKDAGLFSGTSLLEGERVLYAFQVLRDRKVLLALAIRERDMLWPWYRRTLLVGGGMAIALVGLLALVVPGGSAPPVPRRGWLPPLLLWRSGRQRRTEARGQSLPSSAVRVLQALTTEMRGRLAAGETAVADREAELCQKILRFAAGAAPNPQLLDVAEVLSELPVLLAGRARPTVQLPPDALAGPVLVHADRAQLTLALLDCAVSLAAAERGATVLDVQAEVLSVSDSDGNAPTAGTYVCISLAATGAAGAAVAAPLAQSAAEAADLFGLAAAYAPDLGAVVAPMAASTRAGVTVQLWLPEALSEPDGAGAGAPPA